MTRPVMTEQESQEYLRHNLRHNFIVNSLDGACYWFGYSFIAQTIILPLYLSHFTQNPLIFGLIPFLNTAGFLLPQLFTSNFVERAQVKKFFPVNIGFFTERVPILLMTLSAVFFAKNNPLLALITFFICYTWYSAGAGLIIVGWQDMIAKIMPVEMRGRFFGVTNFVGNIAGVLGALSVPLVLEKFEFPSGYVLAFSVATVLIFMSWFWLSLTKEPAVKSTKPHVSQMDYLRSLPRIVRKDRNFLNYLIYQIIYAFSGMASGFLIVYAAENWHLSDSLASGYIIAMQIGQAVTNLLFGFLADRRGHKLALEITAIVAAVSLILSTFAPDPVWFYPIFFLRGAVFSGAMISGISIVMEFSQPEDRPTYIGLANTVPGIASSFAPLLGGWLAKVAGYPPLFIVSAVMGVLGFILLRWTVREPRHHPKAESTLEPGSIETVLPNQDL